MGCYSYFVCAVLLFATVKTGDALRCYKCSSYDGELCADYFNQTEIRRQSSFIHQLDERMPKELYCENEILPYPSINQRAVCMKKVETEYGRKRYSRQCIFLNKDLNTLECPRESINNHRTLDYCEVCDTDLCNSAPSVFKTVQWLAILPILSILLKN